MLKYIKYTSWEQDGRKKLSPRQKEEIKERYRKGDGTQRSLAKEYGVAKNAITYIVNDEYRDRQNKRRGEKQKDYYDKETHRIRQSKYRAKKRQTGYAILAK